MVSRRLPQFSVNGEPKQLFLLIPKGDGSGAKLAKVNIRMTPERVARVATAVSASPFSRVLVNYSVTKEVSCLADHPLLVFARCDYTGLPIMWDQNSLLPPGQLLLPVWTPFRVNASPFLCVTFLVRWG
jgi:hypothetical protein